MLLPSGNPIKYHEQILSLCVFFPFILDIKFVGRTSRGHKAKEEGHTGFLIHLLSVVRALIFLARRIQPFLSLVDSRRIFVKRCVGGIIMNFAY